MKDSFAKVITGNAERNIKSEALKELLHDYHWLQMKLYMSGMHFQI